MPATAALAALRLGTEMSAVTVMTAVRAGPEKAL
jgi:hypothetical protein